MRMRRLCLKTSEAAGRVGLGITSSSEEVYELMLWPYSFWDLNAHHMKSNLEIWMRKERISFSITNHICLQQAFMVHCTWCVHSPLSLLPPSARSACTHTVALPAAAWAEGWRGACTQIYSSYSLWMIDLSLSPTLIMSLKHELCDLNYVLHLQKVPN